MRWTEAEKHKDLAGAFVEDGGGVRDAAAATGDVVVVAQLRRSPHLCHVDQSGVVGTVSKRPSSVCRLVAHEIVVAVVVT